MVTDDGELIDLTFLELVHAENIARASPGTLWLSFPVDPLLCRYK